MASPLHLVVTSVPPGEAPEWVRQGWVEMPPNFVDAAFSCPIPIAEDLLQPSHADVGLDQRGLLFFPDSGTLACTRAALAACRLSPRTRAAWAGV
jgi:hypothetical protein